ncbi:MAG TPA: CPBP family intramembrane glutamic endopeptidase [Candidatus Limnocylindrales bacterium]|nr:CPBP family intramembrane glutamic endopeptidase [Candidatus Limnocylindrales bacterium]
MSANDVFVVVALLAICAMFVLANAGEKHALPRILTFVAGGVLAGALLLIGLALILIASLMTRPAAGSANPIPLGLSLTIAGALGLLYLSSSVRRLVCRVMPLAADSPVSFLSVEWALAFLGQQIGTQLSADVLSAVAAGPPLTNVAILAQDVPLFILAFVGVGLFTRRSLRDCLDRLGLRPPTPRWWLVALAGIVVFLVVAGQIERIANVLTPGTMKRVTDVNNALFRQFNNPGSIVFLGLVAGVAEEVLFRGAMQPRFGLIPTALLFAAVHTQYGITFASLEVFVLGLGLGWMRWKSKSTLPGMVTHAGYDIAAGLISYWVH